MGRGWDGVEGVGVEVGVGVVRSGCDGRWVWVEGEWDGEGDGVERMDVME